MNNTAMYLKFAAGAVLFASWMFLVTMHIQLAGDLIDFIKYILVGLSAHLLTGAGQSSPSFPSSNPPTK